LIYGSTNTERGGKLIKMVEQRVSEDVRRNKAFAERVLVRADRQTGFAADQVASMSKWLMASLLAVNGAGALAAINSQTTAAWWPAALFGLGMVFALLNGVVLQEIYNNSANELFESDKYWTDVSIHGVRDALIEEKLLESAKNVMRYSYLSPLAGWVSGVLFLLAGGLLSTALLRENTGNTKRCAALLHDIISSHPKRPDGIELFTALGCKAGGGVSVFGRQHLG
jgi:hypothetical protein